MLSDRSPGPGAKLGQRLAKFDIGRTRLIDPGSVGQQVKVMTNFPGTLGHICPISATRAQLSLTHGNGWALGKLSSSSLGPFLLNIYSITIQTYWSCCHFPCVYILFILFMMLSIKTTEPVLFYWGAWYWSEYELVPSCYLAGCELAKEFVALTN